MIDCDLLTVQGTLKSLLQHHSSEVSLLWHSALLWSSCHERPGFNPWVGKIPWRRERLPTSVFWPGEFHGLYSPWGCKESYTAKRLSLSLFSHPYMTPGKAIALTRQTFVGKVMSLLFNILSRFVVAFLPRSKRLLISWLQSPSAVIWSPRK